MPETVDTAKEIIKIKREIQEIKQSQEAEMHFNRSKYEELITLTLEGNKLRAEVFLEVDSLKSLKEIQEIIMRTIGGSQPTIWRAFDHLEANGVIFKLEDTKNRSPVYAKPRWVKMLRIDDYVRQKFPKQEAEKENVRSQPGSSDTKPDS